MNESDRSFSSQGLAWERLIHLQAQQVRQLRFFLLLSTGWLILIVVLLRLEQSSWQVAPFGLLLALVNLGAWLNHRNEERAAFALRQSIDSSSLQPNDQPRLSNPDSMRSASAFTGLGSMYLVLALAGLYFAVLPAFRVPQKPPEIAVAASAPSTSPTVPMATGYAARPGFGYPPTMTPYPGAYPRVNPGGNPSAEMPNRTGSFTPFPRPLLDPTRHPDLSSELSNHITAGSRGSAALCFRPGAHGFAHDSQQWDCGYASLDRECSFPKFGLSGGARQRAHGYSLPSRAGSDHEHSCARVSPSSFGSSGGSDTSTHSPRAHQGGPSALIVCRASPKAKSE